MRILIIGAGIIGMTSAYCLVQRGHRVTVIDREAKPGHIGSYQNGGQFSYGYAEPLAAPSLWLQLPVLLATRDGPLSIKPAGLPTLLGWGARFLRNCTPRRFLKHTLSVLQLALASREELGRFLATTPEPFDFRATGKLHIYAHARRLNQVEGLVRLKNRHGLQQTIWDAAACRQHEPALKEYQGPLAGGVYSPLDQSGDTYRLIQALQQTCIRSGLCTIRSQVNLDSFNIKGNGIDCIQTSVGDLSADTYVMCAGADSANLLRESGIRLPMIPVKGYSVTVPARTGAPTINLTDTRHRIVYTKLGERLRVAGIMEFAGYDRRVCEQRIENLLATARQSLPQAGDYARPLSSWAGLRPMTPDGMPIVGRGSWRNLWINTGHGMLGTTLAFGSARLLADLIDGREPAIDAARYSFRRFRGPRA